jgi:predicted outer membrane repeat protein
LFRVGSARIESSSFYNTSSGDRGGGIYSSSISSCFLVHFCDFEDSSASKSGGGMYLSSVSTTDSCSTNSSFGTIFGCLFFHCSLPSSFGGGIYVESPASDGCVRSCVFHQCSSSSSSSSSGGGGIYFISLPSLDEDEFLVYFSLFHENDAPNGKDIYLSGTSFSSSPFSFSYSTHINEGRVSQSGDGMNDDDYDDWLKNVEDPFMRI